MSENNADLPIEQFDMWCRVDLMGHNQKAGRLSVVNTGVEVLYRLDVPDGAAFHTEYFGKGSIYSLMPTTEEACRLIAEKLGTSAPISAWDLPEEWREAIRAVKAKALPAPAADDGPSDLDDARIEDDGIDDDDDDDLDERLHYDTPGGF